MKSIILLSSLVIGITSFGYVKPSAMLGKTEWWRARQNKEVILWIDHLGKTNKTTRVVGSTNDVSTSSHGIKVVISKDLVVKSLTISSGSRTSIEDISKIAPGTYDLVNGKWWDEMTDSEKLAMWTEYDKKVELAKQKDLELRSAPAKFDVSLTVDEYKASLLEGRDTNTITRLEWMEIRRQLAIYKDEWIRVNDPENWRKIPMPDIQDRRTERQKMRMRSMRRRSK